MTEANQKIIKEMDEQVPAHKASRTRSPAYPGINLETAIKRTRQLYDQDKLNEVPLKIAAIRWGFKEKSSGGLITAAALKSFGLIKDSGSGKSRKVQVTEDARRILLDQRPESPERDNAIKQAALKPKLHHALWKKWGADIPPDDTFAHELIFEERFNENSVNDVIKEYKDTIRFAKLTKSDTLSSNDKDKNEFEVEDYVQWESQGVYQFEKPMRITGFSEDDTFAFVEGTNTGIPVGQLLKMESIDKDFGGKKPLGTTPPMKLPPLTAGLNNEVFSLEEGPVVLQWPAKMSQESYEDFKGWVELIVRKAGRAVVKKELGEEDS